MRMVPGIIATGFGLLAAPALWAIDDNVNVANPQPVTDPLMHISVNGETPGANPRIELSAWQKAGNVIRLYVDWNTDVEGPATSYHSAFSIPAPPDGNYTVIYYARPRSGQSFEQVASTDAEVQQRWPQDAPAAFIWPPEPTPLDSVSYYFTPFNSCQSGSPGGASVNEDEDGDGVYEDRVSVIQSFEECELVKLRRLQSVTMGRLEAGTHRLSAWYQFDDLTLDPIPPLDRHAFEVRPVLPGRLSGSWYNPDQSGHGLSLEVVEEGERLLAYWFTFDDLGNQAWIIGDGAVDETGTSVTMDAMLHTGGRFPPDFDPEDVDGTPWGTMTLAFDDCSNGTLSWDSELAGFSDGEMPVKRLSTISGYGCTTPPPESLLDNTWRLTPYPVVEESAEPPAGTGEGG